MGKAKNTHIRTIYFAFQSISFPIDDDGGERKDDEDKPFTMTTLRNSFFRNLYASLEDRNHRRPGGEVGEFGGHDWLEIALYSGVMVKDEFTSFGILLVP